MAEPIGQKVITVQNGQVRVPGTNQPRPTTPYSLNIPEDFFVVSNGTNSSITKILNKLGITPQIQTMLMSNPEMLRSFTSYVVNNPKAIFIAQVTILEEQMAPRIKELEEEIKWVSAQGISEENRTKVANKLKEIESITVTDGAGNKVNLRDLIRRRDALVTEISQQPVLQRQLHPVDIRQFCRQFDPRFRLTDHLGKGVTEQRFGLGDLIVPTNDEFRDPADFLFGRQTPPNPIFLLRDPELRNSPTFRINPRLQFSLDLQTNPWGFVIETNFWDSVKSLQSLDSEHKVGLLDRLDKLHELVDDPFKLRTEALKSRTQIYVDEKVKAINEEVANFRKKIEARGKSGDISQEEANKLREELSLFIGKLINDNLNGTVIIDGKAVSGHELVQGFQLLTNEGKENKKDDYTLRVTQSILARLDTRIEEATQSLSSMILSKDEREKIEDEYIKQNQEALKKEMSGILDKIHGGQAERWRKVNDDWSILGCLWESVKYGYGESGEAGEEISLASWSSWVPDRLPSFSPLNLHNPSGTVFSTIPAIRKGWSYVLDSDLTLPHMKEKEAVMKEHLKKLAEYTEKGDYKNFQIEYQKFIGLFDQFGGLVDNYLQSQDNGRTMIKSTLAVAGAAALAIPTGGGSIWLTAGAMVAGGAATRTLVGLADDATSAHGISWGRTGADAAWGAVDGLSLFAGGQLSAAGRNLVGRQLGLQLLQKQVTTTLGTRTIQVLNMEGASLAQRFLIHATTTGIRGGVTGSITGSLQGGAQAYGHIVENGGNPYILTSLAQITGHALKTGATRAVLGASLDFTLTSAFSKFGIKTNNVGELKQKCCQVLGVSENATQAEVESAIRTKVPKLSAENLDKGGSLVLNASEGELFLAYDTLKNLNRWKSIITTPKSSPIKIDLGVYQNLGMLAVVSEGAQQPKTTKIADNVTLAVDESLRNGSSKVSTVLNAIKKIPESFKKFFNKGKVEIEIVPNSKLPPGKNAATTTRISSEGVKTKILISEDLAKALSGAEDSLGYELALVDLKEEFVHANQPVRASSGNIERDVALRIRDELKGRNAAQGGKDPNVRQQLRKVNDLIREGQYKDVHQWAKENSMGKDLETFTREATQNMHNPHARQRTNFSTVAEDVDVDIAKLTTEEKANFNELRSLLGDNPSSEDLAGAIRGAQNDNVRLALIEAELLNIKSLGATDITRNLRLNELKNLVKELKLGKQFRDLYNKHGIVERATTRVPTGKPLTRLEIGDQLRTGPPADRAKIANELGFKEQGTGRTTDLNDTGTRIIGGKNGVEIFAEGFDSAGNPAGEFRLAEDLDGHGGSVWKLCNNQNNRISSIDCNGIPINSKKFAISDGSVRKYVEVKLGYKNAKTLVKHLREGTSNTGRKFQGTYSDTEIENILKECGYSKKEISGAMS